VGVRAVLPFLHVVLLSSDRYWALLQAETGWLLTPQRRVQSAATDNVTLEQALPLVWSVFPFVENIINPFLFVTYAGVTLSL